MLFTKKSILPQLLIGAGLIAGSKALDIYFPLDLWTPIVKEVLIYLGGAFGVNVVAQTVRHMAPDSVFKTGTEGLLMKPTQPPEDAEEVGEPKPFIPEVKGGE